VELASLEEERQSRIRVIQDYDTQIAALGKRFADTCLACQEEGTKMNELQQKRTKLEAVLRYLENNNEAYLKVRRIVDERVSSLLPKDLLKIALLSLTQTIRNDPTKYCSLINCNTPLPAGYGGQYNSLYGYSFSAYGTYYSRPKDGNPQDCETIVIEETEQLFNRIVKEMVDQTIDDCSIHTTASTSSLPLIPSPEKEQ
jgi:hypothetical protein